MQIFSFSKVICMTKPPTSIYHVKQPCLQHIKIYPGSLFGRSFDTLLSNVIALEEKDISLLFPGVTLYPAKNLLNLLVIVPVENIILKSPDILIILTGTNICCYNIQTTVIMNVWFIVLVEFNFFFLQLKHSYSFFKRLFL